MRVDSLRIRLDKLMPALSDISEQEEAKASFELLETWQPHFFDRLEELGLSDLIPEIESALKTIGPRPFGHSRRDDRPVWQCVEEVENRHHESVYRIKAAYSLAWADAFLASGEPEDGKHVVGLREYAARMLEQEAKDRQTVCDQCGAALDGWRCHSFTREGGQVVLCKRCGGGHETFAE